MGKQVDSMEVDAAPPADAPKKPDAPAPPPPPPPVLDLLSQAASLLEKAGKSRDVRGLPGRALRLAAAARPRVKGADVAAFVGGALADGEAKTELLAAVKQAGADAAAPSASTDNGDAPAAPPAPPAPCPEVDLFAYLVTVVFLLDAGKAAEAATLATSAMDRSRAANRRTLDAVAARVAFYFSLAHERAGTLPLARAPLLDAHRTACARHDEAGAEVLLNLLLRNYLAAGLVDAAEALRAKARRADPPRSPQQFARYLYYLGVIRACRLEYSDARDALLQAARKAPTAAHGFRVAVAKWLTVVRLLLGEVPRLSELAELGPPDAGPLAPYVALCRAVRAGDLAAFQAAASAHAPAFAADATAPAVARLRNAVIRAGLSRAVAAYSRIPLTALAAKLGLPSADDAEAVAAKAIADGSLAATVDRAARCVVAAADAVGYEGPGPRDAFYARTAFCLELHNEAVRALRYEAGAGERAGETAEQARERARAEEEMARAIAEGEEEDDEDDMM